MSDDQKDLLRSLLILGGGVIAALVVGHLACATFGYSFCLGYWV